MKLKPLINIAVVFAVAFTVNMSYAQNAHKGTLSKTPPKKDQRTDVFKRVPPPKHQRSTETEAGPIKFIPNYTWYKLPVPERAVLITNKFKDLLKLTPEQYQQTLKVNMEIAQKMDEVRILYAAGDPNGWIDTEKTLLRIERDRLLFKEDIMDAEQRIFWQKYERGEIRKIDNNFKEDFIEYYDF